MNNATFVAATTGGNAAAAIAQAIKASGAIVHVEPHDFMSIVSRSEAPLIVVTEPGSGLFGKKHYQYLTGYKGLIFYAKSRDPLQFTGNFELIVAKGIWIPA